MIDKKYYNNKTVFAIRRNDDKCFYLSLTPENYEKQFISFVRAARLSRQEIHELKTKIQVELFKNVKQKLRQFKEQEEKIKKQQVLWVSQKKSENLRTQSEELDERLSGQGRINENLNSVQSQNNLLRGQQIQRIFKRQASFGQYTKQEIGIQTASNAQSSGKQNDHQGQVILLKDNRRFSFSQTKIPDQNKQQSQQYANIKSDRSEEGQMMSSPRFHCIHPQPQTIPQMKIQKKGSEEDIVPVPRALPQMVHLQSNPNSKYQSNQKSTQVNSPQTKKGAAKQKVYYAQASQIVLDSSNKRIFFLENYQRFKQQQNNQSLKPHQFELSFQYKPKLKGNPHIFQKLYQEQTTSFKNKNMAEINTSEENIYNEIIRSLSKKKQPSITHFQNMSTKTTKSFRSKFQPQPKTRQIQEEEDYQRQFILHLQRKQQQRKRKELLSKEKQGNDEHKFIPKGSHCQSKILREKLKKQRKDIQQKQKMIRQRIKSQHINYQSYQDQSCSPASRNKISRVCQCCSPSKSKKKPSPRQNKINPSNKNKNPMIQNNAHKYGSNKKYVSSILNQSLREFEKQIKESKI